MPARQAIRSRLRQATRGWSGSEARREGISEPIELKAGKIRWTPDAEFPEVQVQGVIRKRDHFWSITLFLVNGQDEPKKSRDGAWLFQPELIVESPDGKPIFHRRPTQRDLGKSDPLAYLEEQELAMMYRNSVEFGVGHGVSIHAECPEGVCDHAVRISTKVVPSYEVQKTTPPTEIDFPKLAGLVLDMKELGETATTDFDKKIRPLLVAYEDWIKKREAEIKSPDMKPHKDAGRVTLERCRTALSRIESGLKLLSEDEKAAEAFRFANLAMWQQRYRSIYSQKRRRDQEADLRGIDVPGNRSWYPFQLAFILLNLPGITKLDHKDRTGGSEAVADLLWFPTGGGKTEAYLGLIGVHDGTQTVARNGGRPFGPARRCSVDEIHASAADHPAVSAGHCLDLRMRDDSSGRRKEMGHGALPHRLVGRPEDHSEHDRAGGRIDSARTRAEKL